MDKCPECKSIDIDEDSTHGCIVCTNCGLQLSNYYISMEQEWRDNEQSRVGLPDILDIGLSTSIPITSINLSQLHSKSTLSRGVRKRLLSHEKLKYYINKLNLPNQVIILAGSIYEKYCETNNISRKDVTLLACIYLSSLQLDIPRTFKELESIASTQHRLITAEDIQIYAIKIKDIGTELQITPIQLIPRYCSYLKLSYLENQVLLNALKIKSNKYSAQTLSSVIIKITCEENNIDITLDKISLVTLSSINMIRLALLDLRN
jgi:transcription initiation factor TFIIB